MIPSRSSSSFLSARSHSDRRLLFQAGLIAATFGFSFSALAQDGAPPPPPPPPAATPSDTPAPGGAPGDAPRQRRNFDPEEMRNRMMDNLRSELEVTQDDEWNIVKDRVQAVMEARRTASAGMAAGMFRLMAPGRGGPGRDAAAGGGGGPRVRANFGGPSSPEMESLQNAIKDKAPDAEVQARLERVRQARKDAEAKLQKAQDDLRAVLNVRQEAVAVTLGLLN